MTSTAAAKGELWGARARDWAQNEEPQTPVYEEALHRAGVGRGDHVLEVGCGSGVALGVAASRGAQVTGLDASEALLAIARERVPTADLHPGDLQSLPFADDTFDAVCGFNAFFFADDMVEALREAGRVAKPGAPVVIQVWGAPERCGLTPMVDAVKALLGVPGGGNDLWRPGALEALATQAGLTPQEAFDVAFETVLADEVTLTRLMLSPGVIVGAVRRAGEEPVRQAIVGAMERWRTPDGGYRFTNEWHVLLARA